MEIQLASLDVKRADTLHYVEGRVRVLKVPRIGEAEKKYVIKTLSFESAEAMNEGLQEAYTMAQLNHPHFVSVLGIEVESHRSTLHLILPYFPDGDLYQELRNRASSRHFWAENTLWELYKQLVNAFAYLQDQRIVHRDVKPQNILVRKRGQDLSLYVSDLGSAARHNDDDMTITGTPLYLSPLLRQAYSVTQLGEGTGTVRHDALKSDVYSLGLTFLYMASLQDMTDLALLDGLSAKIEQRLQSLQYTDRIKHVIRGMLQIDEQHRPTFVDLRDNTFATVCASCRSKEIVTRTCIELPRYCGNCLLKGVGEHHCPRCLEFVNI